MKIFLYVCVHIKTIPWRFRILNLKNFWIICPWSFANFLKSRLIFNIYYFWMLTFHISHVRAHVSQSKRCFNVKSSTYYFPMKTKILADFQICISVPSSSNCLNKLNKVKRLCFISFKNKILVLFIFFVLRYFLSLQLEGVETLKYCCVCRPPHGKVEYSK